MVWSVNDNGFLNEAMSNGAVESDNGFPNEAMSNGAVESDNGFLNEAMSNGAVESGKQDWSKNIFMNGENLK